MANITRGVQAIEVGAIAGDGGPGTTLLPLGYTKEGTASLNQEDPDTTQLYAEEVDSPVVTISKAGLITFTWTVMNPDTATLVTLFGGTASGTSPNKTWNMPSAIVAQELTLKVTPQTGMKLVFPRASVSARLTGDYTRNDVFGIVVVATALQPTKSGVGPVQYIE